MASKIVHLPFSTFPSRYKHGFTLVELLVVIGIIAVLTSLLLPTLSKAKSIAQGSASLNNTRQLNLAWTLYADDHQGQLPYNLGGTGRSPMSIRSHLNWVNNVLNWELDADNTNSAGILDASLARYASGSLAIYRCPADRTLSPSQRQAGWNHRIRSYSMNAMVGDAGELSKTGKNQNNPGYVQFFRIDQIRSPSEIFTFIEEHPDSINDGYFINQSYGVEWLDLPASDHSGGGTTGFCRRPQ